MSIDPAAGSFQMYPCPAGCGERFGTVNGALMHAVNMEDEQHADTSGKHDAITQLIDLERERCER